MDKRMIKSIMVVAIVLLLGGGFFYYVLSQKNTSSSLLEKQPVVQTAQNLRPSQTAKTYTDNSGFTFQYPDDVILKKKDTNDQSTYANVEITSSVAGGKLSLIVSDTKILSTYDWVAKNASAPAAIAKDVKLGDIQAREITIGDSLTTVAIDKGILFTIKVDPQGEKDYWSSVYNTIFSSFSFVSSASDVAAPASSSSDQSVGDVTLEEETVQ